MSRILGSDAQEAFAPCHLKFWSHKYLWQTHVTVGIRPWGCVRHVASDRGCSHAIRNSIAQPDEQEQNKNRYAFLLLPVFSVFPDASAASYSSNEGW